MKQHIYRANFLIERNFTNQKAAPNCISGGPEKSADIPKEERPKKSRYPKHLRQKVGGIAEFELV